MVRLGPMLLHRLCPSRTLAGSKEEVAKVPDQEVWRPRWRRGSLPSDRYLEPEASFEEAPLQANSLPWKGLSILPRREVMAGQMHVHHVAFSTLIAFLQGETER